MFKKKGNVPDPKVRVEKKARKPKKVRNKRFIPKPQGQRKNLIPIIAFVTATIVFSAGLYFVLSGLFVTETYYVLNQNVRAKQLITPEMVTARETGKDTGPIHALDLSEIQRGGVFSRYPLYAGDVIASSNAGPTAVNTLGIPDNWLVTSFSIVSTDAVGGTLGRGDYVDLLGINEFGAQYIFNNLLILEVKFVNQELDGKLDGQTVVGEAMHYTVGLPAEHVAYLHSALHDYDTIKIVKSPVEITYADRDTSKLDQTFKYGPEIGSIDLIKGTDPTFTDVERDESGKPLNRFDGQDSAIEVAPNDDIENEPTEPDLDEEPDLEESKDN